MVQQSQKKPQDQTLTSMNLSKQNKHVIDQKEDKSPHSIKSDNHNSTWFTSMCNKYDFRSIMIICGYYRALHLTNTIYHTPRNILQFTIEYFNFNIYDLGITNLQASHIWLQTYSNNNCDSSQPWLIYPFLKSIFHTKTRITDYEPNKIMQIMINNSSNLDSITAFQFNQFYQWFIGFCNVFQDLYPYFHISPTINVPNLNRYRLQSFSLSKGVDSIFDSHTKTTSALSNSSLGAFTLRISSIPNCIEIAAKCKSSDPEKFISKPVVRFYCLQRKPNGAYITLNVNRESTEFHQFEQHQWFPSIAAIINTLESRALSFNGNHMNYELRLQNAASSIIDNHVSLNELDGKCQVYEDNKILISDYKQVQDLPDWLQRMNKYERNTKIIVLGYLRLKFDQYNINSILPQHAPRVVIFLCVKYFNFDMYSKTKISDNYVAAVWLETYCDGRERYSKLIHLYRTLMPRFIKISRCKQRQPTMQQLNYYFRAFGNDHNIEEGEMRDRNFNAFYKWFAGMCVIIKDLRNIYQQNEDPLECLFWDQERCVNVLEKLLEGTFILRLYSKKQNGLVISYKSADGKIKNLLLTWTKKGYIAGSTQNKTELYHLIQTWERLKYLYSPTKLIKKRHLFG